MEETEFVTDGELLIRESKQRHSDDILLEQDDEGEFSAKKNTDRKSKIVVYENKMFQRNQNVSSIAIHQLGS